MRPGTPATESMPADAFGMAVKTLRREERSAAKPQPSTSAMILEPQMAQMAQMGILFCVICEICGSISGAAPEAPELRRAGAQKVTTLAA